VISADAQRIRDAERFGNKGVGRYDGRQVGGCLSFRLVNGLHVLDRIKRLLLSQVAK
jgi:hypothetical protein